MLGELPGARNDTRALYYVPKDGKRPKHIPKAWGVITQGPGGPDYDPKAKTGGFGQMIGGTWEEGQRGWAQTKAGYWINLSRSNPIDLMRLNVVEGEAIKGARPDHFWKVPHLISRVDGAWRSALEPVLTPEGFRPPEPYIDLTDRLRDTVEQAERLAQDDPEALLVLSVDILAINYHISREDLEVTGWFVESMMPKIIMAAAGLLSREDE